MHVFRCLSLASVSASSGESPLLHMLFTLRLYLILQVMVAGVMPKGLFAAVASVVAVAVAISLTRIAGKVRMCVCLFVCVSGCMWLSYLCTCLLVCGGLFNMCVGLINISNETTMVITGSNAACTFLKAFTCNIARCSGT